MILFIRQAGRKGTGSRLSLWYGSCGRSAMAEKKKIMPGNHEVERDQFLVRFPVGRKPRLAAGAQRSRR